MAFSYFQSIALNYVLYCHKILSYWFKNISFAVERNDKIIFPLYMFCPSFALLCLLYLTVDLGNQPVVVGSKLPQYVTQSNVLLALGRNGSDNQDGQGSIFVRLLLEDFASP